jgi:16S rRNA (adenine1518-N6/adenine1519-N6)-dimethyltransferase
MTLSRQALTAVLQRHGVLARRSLGQNFVVDPDVVRRIVVLAGIGPGDAVVEVGPGAGSLTLALAESGAEVVAVETDPAMVAVLAEVLDGVVPRPIVVQGDATTIDWAELLSALPRSAPGDRSWAMVANLPYNVAVPIVLHALRTAPVIDPLVVMVQKEVADRLAADPGGKAIGVPTVKLRWYADVEVVLHVPPDAFLPRPRVDSSVVRITRHPPLSDEATASVAFGLVEQAYHQRRKMLRSSLGPEVAAVLDAVGIPPTSRPEQLTASQWAAVAVGVGGSPR